MTDDQSRAPERAEEYESPRVEEIPARDDPLVTAAGKSPPPLAAEWRAQIDDRDQPEPDGREGPPASGA